MRLISVNIVIVIVKHAKMQLIIALLAKMCQELIIICILRIKLILVMKYVQMAILEVKTTICVSNAIVDAVFAQVQEILLVLPVKSITQTQPTI